MRKHRHEPLHRDAVRPPLLLPVQNQCCPNCSAFRRVVHLRKPQNIAVSLVMGIKESTLELLENKSDYYYGCVDREITSKIASASKIKRKTFRKNQESYQ